jgi:tellurite resistance protein
MNQFSRAMQRLPKAQLQKFQSLMTRAMAGKDVSREAAELERVLPAELRTLMGSFQMPGMAAAGAQAESGPMSADEARKIVEEAKASGQISETEANELLAASQTDQTTEKASQEGTGFSKLWRKFTQKKS